MSSIESRRERKQHEALSAMSKASTNLIAIAYALKARESEEISASTNKATKENALSNSQVSHENSRRAK